MHLCRKVWGWFPLRVGIPAVPVESENREQIFAVLDECKARGFGVAVVRRQCGKSCALKLSQYSALALTWTVQLAKFRQ